MKPPKAKKGAKEPELPHAAEICTLLEVLKRDQRAVLEHHGQHCLAVTRRHAPLPLALVRMTVWNRGMNEPSSQRLPFW